MSEGKSFVPCPSCKGTLLTEAYEKRFGRCMSCYKRDELPIDHRISKALGGGY